MKKLTQAVFKGQPSNVISAAVNAKGELMTFNCSTELVFSSVDTHHGAIGSTFGVIDDGYDPTDWKNSATNRESK